MRSGACRRYWCLSRPILILSLLAQSARGLASGADLLLVGSWTSPSYAEDVVVKGNYAYLADYTAGLQILDVSIPSNPKKVGSFKIGGATWSVAVSGRFAYVADNYSGLNVIDVSDPAEPRLVGAWTNSGCLLVRVFGSYAYIKSANPQGGAFKIIDVSEPTNLATVEWTNTLYNPNEVCVIGNNAYVSDLYQGLVIYDVADPIKPKLLGAYDPNTNAPSTTGFAISGQFTYVTDNDFFGYKGRGLVIIDTGAPSEPQPVGEHATSNSADGVAVSDQYAFTISHPWIAGDGMSALQVFDVSSPTGPQLLSTTPLPSTATRVAVQGGYVFLSSGGLQVFKIITSPEFERVSLQPGGGVRLLISGVTGGSGRIQRSSNLSAWADWHLIDFTSNLVEVLDFDGVSTASSRFYRIIQP